MTLFVRGRGEQRALRNVLRMFTGASSKRWCDAGSTSSQQTVQTQIFAATEFNENKK